jgi:tetratricopeptide (TPR) repeat protein
VLVVAAGAALVLGVVAVGYGLFRPRPPQPPAVALADLDPDVADAVRAAREEVEARPLSAPAWGKLGMVLFAHNLYRDALVCLARAEELDPAEARWPYFQGLIRLRSDSDQGVACLERAVRQAGRDYAPRLRLAEALLALDRLDEAERHYRVLAESEGPNPRIDLGLGLVAYRTGNLVQSIPHLTAAADSPFAAKAARSALAEVHARLGNAEAAEAQRRQEAERPADVPWPDPLLAEAERLQTGTQFRLGRADTLLARGQVDEAVEVLSQLVAAHPEVDEAHVKLGAAYIRLKRLDAAEAELREALRLRPDLPEAHFLLGGVVSMRRGPAEAEACYRKAVELKPSHALAHYNLGRCRLEQDDKAGALEGYRAALRCRPDLVEVHVAAAELESDQGRHAEARAHLEDALRLAPGHEKAKQLLANLPPAPR